jgi:hypothetical protein
VDLAVDDPAACDEGSHVIRETTCILRISGV